MKITGWHIDGYGVHHDLGVTDVADGLTIVAGPNEAGKTTLQHFLVGMLFGFTAVNRPDHHAPLRGGTYGGRLFVTDEHGRALTIHRGARKSSLHVTGPEGPLPEAEVQALLGGASRDLYESIFAVHIDELDELKALADDAVRDRVFSAGVLGAGRTAQRALGLLAQERDELLKPGGRSADKYAIKRLRAEVVEARSELAEVRRQAKGLPGLISRIGALEADRDRARHQRTALQDRRNLLAAVTELWPTWTHAAEARSALHRLGTVPEVPDAAAARLTTAVERHRDLAAEQARLEAELAHATAALEALPTPGPALAHAEPIAELAAALPSERERLTSLAEHQARAQHLEQELSSALAELGPERDEAWLIAQPEPNDAGTALRAAAGAVERAHQQLTHAEDVRRRTAAEIDDARAEQHAAEAALAAEPHHPVERSRQAAEDASSLVTLLGQREAIVHRLALAHQPTPAAPSPLPPFLVPALAVVGVLVALAGVGALASGAPLPGLVGLAAGVGVAALALVVRNGTDRASAPVAAPAEGPGQLARHLAEVDEALAPLLAGLGLEQAPTLAEATNLRVRAEQLAAEAVRLDRERAQVAQRGAALAERATRFEQRCAAEVREAHAAIAQAEQAWSDWLASQHLPSTLDPAAAGQLLDALTRARTLHRNLEGARAEVRRTEAQHQAFAERVRQLVHTSGLAVAAHPDTDPLATVEELATALRRAQEAERRCADATIAVDAARRQHLVAQQRAAEAATTAEALVAELGATSVADAQARIELATIAAELRSRIQRAERDLTAAIGSVPERLEAARDLLGQADPTRWRLELDDLARDLRASDDRIDDHTTELAHLRRERDELERSADVPRCELRVTDLEAQLVAAVTRWASLTVAHQMVEGTLARYQRERQPEVVKRAAAHFQQITDGRYPRLEVRDRSIVAIDQTGVEVPAEALSTGTVQQLYLCMRFALAESYARTARLPLLLDDITVNADGGRMPRLAETIAAVAAEHQVFAFTCHDATVELLQAAAPAARVLTLEPSTTARRMGLAAG